MNRQEYIAELKRRLQKLPFDEIKKAVDYCEEYFDDAGVENEQRVIEELGSPANMAAQVLADFVVNDTVTANAPKKKPLTTVWLVILAVFASPVAFPIAIALASVAMAVSVSIFAVAISLGVAGLAVAVSGLACLVIGFMLLVMHFPTGIAMLGCALVLLGLGGAMVMGVAYLAKVSFAGLARAMGKGLQRRMKK